MSSRGAESQSSDDERAAKRSKTTDDVVVVITPGSAREEVPGTDTVSFDPSSHTVAFKYYPPVATHKIRDNLTSSSYRRLLDEEIPSEALTSSDHTTR